MTNRTLIAGVIAFLPLCVNAQGFYASATTALALPENSAGSFTHEGTQQRVDLGLKRAIELSGSLGHAWPNGWRVEARVAYRSHDVLRLFSDTELTGVFEQLRDAPARSPVHTVDATGTLSALSLMANVSRSFRGGETFRPYVSAGVGMVKLRGEVERIEHERIGSQKPTIVETGWKGNDTVGAFEAGAGMDYALSKRAALRVSYAVFVTDEGDFGAFAVDTLTHRLGVGLEVRF